MKTLFRSKFPALALGAALILGVTAARADDETTSRHRRPAKAATTESLAQTRQDGQIPTRDNRHARQVQGSQTGGANGEEYRVPTGSHLPRRYHRRGHTTDLEDNTFIYDQNDQRLRGTNSVGDSLRSVPGVSVRGGR